MIWIWIAGIVLVLVLVIILLLLKVTVDIHYTHLHKKQTFTLHMKVFNLKVYTLDIPVATTGEEGIKLEEKKQTVQQNKVKKKKLSFLDLLHNFQHIQEWMTFLLRLHKTIQPMFKRIVVHTLYWRTEFGLEEAPLTAQATGWIWSVKTTLIGFASRYVTFPVPPTLAVHPLYQQNLAHMQFHCMFSFRVGHAIHAGITILKHWRQRPKLSS